MVRAIQGWIEQPKQDSELFTWTANANHFLAPSPSPRSPGHCQTLAGGLDRPWLAATANCRCPSR
jgi:hypothetical protein